MCYLDDILIYSINEKVHEDHIQAVLQHLVQFGLYCMAEKCQFRFQEVDFLNFVIYCAGIYMGLDCISAIEDWPSVANSPGTDQSSPVDSNFALGSDWCTIFPHWSAIVWTGADCDIQQCDFWTKSKPIWKCM